MNAEDRLSTGTTSSTGSRHSSTLATVIRGGLRQARIELRIQLFTPMVLTWLIWPVIGVVALWFMRDIDVMGTAVSLAQLGIPGVLTMTLVSAGLLGVAGQLLMEREDGTLLRAKAVPHGMPAQLLGDMITNVGTALAPTLAILIPAGLLFEDVLPSGAEAWFTLAWVCLLGLFACLPLGAVIGAILRSPALLWVAAMAAYGLLAISGVFYPISALPVWMQLIGMALPVYWIGLGMRSALLPPEAVALEAGASWHTLETVAVLGVWSLAGFVVATWALRRMARKQSGSAVAAARDRVLSQGY